MRRKDLCWSVRAVYILEKLSDVSGHGLGEAGCYKQDDQKQDSSGSSPDEGRRAVRINYSEVENLRLVSLSIKHSVDPIRGTDQSRQAY